MKMAPKAGTVRLMNPMDNFRNTATKFGLSDNFFIEPAFDLAKRSN